MTICFRGCNSSLSRSFQKSYLNQIWFIYFLYGGLFFGHGGGYSVHPHRPAVKLYNNSLKNFFIKRRKSALINFQKGERLHDRVFGDGPVIPLVHLGKITASLEQIVGGAWGEAATSCNFRARIVGDDNVQHRRGTFDNFCYFLGAIKFKTVYAAGK